MLILLFMIVFALMFLGISVVGIVLLGEAIWTPVKVGLIVGLLVVTCSLVAALIYVLRHILLTTRRLRGSRKAPPASTNDAT